MKSTDIYIYFAIFIVPATLLYLLALYIYLRSAYRKDGMLLFLSVFTFGLISTLEFIRHISPIEYSPFITQFLIGPTSLLALGFTFHLTYTLATIKHEFKLPFMPHIIYSPILLHFIIAAFLYLDTDDFYQYSIWIHRENMLYDLWMFSMVGLALLASTIVLFKGARKTHDKVRRKLLKFLYSGTILLALLFILMITIFDKNSLPPVPTILLGFSTSILITLGIIKYNLSPSLMERYRIMFDMSPTALMVLNENLQIIEMNKQAIETFPKKHRHSVASLFESAYNQKQALLVLQKLKKMGSIKDYQIEFQDQFSSKKRTYSIIGSTIRFGDETHYYIKWRDITDELEREKLVEHLAYYDSLTNIYNRTYFVPNASKSIEKYIMSDETLALILLDLNFFKLINDTYGHAIGDLVLIKTASILKQALQNEDSLIARLGGDEFVILIENLPNREYVQTIITQLRYKFEQSPFENHKVNITISPSIGYALAPHESIHLDELIQIADRRMYEDKVRIKALDSN
jgi:diguanylate cyclase (GGDEF)-like protein